ncbi:MAG: TIGR04551 family protein [Anaeromyxobacteraceae bacterium]
MSRLSTALAAASLLLPALAGAQTPPPASPAKPPSAAPANTAPAKPAAPSPSLDATPPAATPPGAELDPATRDLVRREVERAKEDMRDEIRAEIQGAQSAREFLETTAPAGDRPKLEFLQLNGYLRTRGELFDNLDLRRDLDRSGYYLFPRPLIDPAHRGTLTSANMRFRVEPTLNVSEQVRVMGQLDLLDDLVLGQTPQGGLLSRSDATNRTFDARTQVPPENGVNSDRSSLVVKRAWAEVQTPVGLLSFGRMPSSWGMGLLAHAGNGIDDDLGDSVDRLQFALMPLDTRVGKFVLVPMYEFVSTGVTSSDPARNRGIGQPFDRDQFDDARALGLKIVHEDTAEEMKRKLDRNEASTSFGAWYMYKTQTYEFSGFANPTTLPSEGQPADVGTTGNSGLGTAVRRDAYAHVLDLWARRESRRFHLEAEFAGVLGQIGNADTTPLGQTPIGPVLLRQFGGALNAGWKLADGKLTIGGEAGFASGDTNPGLGNRPGRVNSGATAGSPQGNGARCGRDPISGGTICDVDGEQFASGDKVLDIRNFRFNPAYRVDLVLWREILQGVTDAWYLKPTLRYELLEGLAAKAAIVYSQAMYASSTPSGTARPLGIEADLGLSYHSDDGFQFWVDYGVLQPLSGLEYGNATGHTSLSRGHALRSGLAVKF